MKSRLAIIPARKGSKRISNKNIRNFCGKPMFLHSLAGAVESGKFSDIHISTDSDEIYDLATSMGYNPGFMRPSSLAGDHTSMMEVLRFVIEKYYTQGKAFDTIALIYATSPLISHVDIKNACESFESSNRMQAMLAVTEYPAPIEHAFRMNTEHDLLPVNQKSLAMRTQDIEKTYYDAGMFAFYTPEYILKQQAGGDFTTFRGFHVPSYRVTDIDWPDDWERAERMYKALQ